jgi:hypothetical protein
LPPLASASGFGFGFPPCCGFPLCFGFCFFLSSSSSVACEISFAIPKSRILFFLFRRGAGYGVAPVARCELRAIEDIASERAQVTTAQAPLALRAADHSRAPLPFHHLPLPTGRRLRRSACRTL